MNFFYNQVASNLRSKNFRPDEISQVISELRSHVAMSGTDPEKEFGSAVSYTAQYDKKRQKTSFGIGMKTAYIAATILVVGYFLLRLRVPSLDGGVGFGFFLTLAVYGLVTFVGFVISLRIPPAEGSDR